MNNKYQGGQAITLKWTFFENRGISQYQTKSNRTCQKCILLHTLETAPEHSAATPPGVRGHELLEPAHGLGHQQQRRYKTAKSPGGLCIPVRRGLVSPARSSQAGCRYLLFNFNLPYGILCRVLKLRQAYCQYAVANLGLDPVLVNIVGQ